MTANQIAFNRAIEDARHNRVSEEIEKQKAAASTTSAGASMISSRALEAQAQIASARQIEDARHNLRDEDIRVGQLEIGRGQLAEQQRANKMAEKLTQNAQNETQRHNIAQESVGQTQAKASMLQAQAAGTQAAAAREQARVAGERQIEDARHNLVAESIGQLQADTAAKQQITQAAVNQSIMATNYAEADLASSKKFSNYAGPIIRGFSALANALS